MACETQARVARLAHPLPYRWRRKSLTTAMPVRSASIWVKQLQAKWPLWAMTHGLPMTTNRGYFIRVTCALSNWLTKFAANFSIKYTRPTKYIKFALERQIIISDEVVPNRLVGWVLITRRVNQRETARLPSPKSRQAHHCLHQSHKTGTAPHRVRQAGATHHANHIRRVGKRVFFGAHHIIHDVSKMAKILHQKAGW